MTYTTRTQTRGIFIMTTLVPLGHAVQQWNDPMASFIVEVCSNSLSFCICVPIILKLCTMINFDGQDKHIQTCSTTFSPTNGLCERYRLFNNFLSDKWTVTNGLCERYRDPEEGCGAYTTARYCLFIGSAVSDVYACVFDFSDGFVFFEQRV